jgi:hypothetical protein
MTSSEVVITVSVLALISRVPAIPDAVTFLALLLSSTSLIITSSPAAAVADVKSLGVLVSYPVPASN